MIQDKQRQHKNENTSKASPARGGSSMLDGSLQDVENNKRYAQIMNELDQAKMDILALKEQNLR